MVKSKLNRAQKIARAIGVKGSPNSWFRNETGTFDIDDPDNGTVKLEETPWGHTWISLGCVTTKHLPGIAKEAARPHLRNTFATPLDDKK